MIKQGKMTTNQGNQSVMSAPASTFALGIGAQVTSDGCLRHDTTFNRMPIKETKKRIAWSQEEEEM